MLFKFFIYYKYCEKKTLRLHVLVIDFKKIICFLLYPLPFEKYQSVTVN